MKKINECNILKNSMTTLQETSKDTSSETIEFMTQSQIRVINFDDVKTKYLNELGVSEEMAKSVDAIFMNDDNIIFIEFKNGKISNDNIKMKVKDSLLIFGDIVGATLSEARENISFFLVYSKEKHAKMNARSRKAMYLANLSKQDFNEFGLKGFSQFYFKSVKALLPNELERELKKLV